MFQLQYTYLGVYLGCQSWKEYKIGTDKRLNVGPKKRKMKNVIMEDNNEAKTKFYFTMDDSYMVNSKKKYSLN